jgi:hypothetical protein
LSYSTSPHTFLIFMVLLYFACSSILIFPDFLIFFLNFHATFHPCATNFYGLWQSLLICIHHSSFI